ncbi:hypothetical protein, partial [Agathobacter rectalis]|uniref:hypothetical protein n=1 Tax=Agathobacter rectalis TaxID=39491 RepID=UPI0027D2BFED
NKISNIQSPGMTAVKFKEYSLWCVYVNFHIKPGFKKINIPNAKIMIPPPIDHHIFTISFRKFRFLSFKNWELFN